MSASTYIFTLVSLTVAVKVLLIRYYFLIGLFKVVVAEVSIVFCNVRLQCTVRVDRASSTFNGHRVSTTFTKVYVSAMH